MENRTYGLSLLNFKRIELDFFEKTSIIFGFLNRGEKCAFPISSVHERNKILDRIEFIYAALSSQFLSVSHAISTHYIAYLSKFFWLLWQHALSTIQILIVMEISIHMTVQPTVTASSD
jgi:hypothetical protein